MYKTLADEQIYRFYPGKRDAVNKLLARMVQQGRIYRNRWTMQCSIDNKNSKRIDNGLLASVWVLLDFIDKVEYHHISDFPVKISFFADGEIYEIIHVPFEQEILLNHALSKEEKNDARRIVLVDCPEQIELIDIPNTSGFCSVETDGTVQYYKLE
jgi:hypothetical protein